jgi:hypothetical protein
MDASEHNRMKAGCPFEGSEVIGFVPVAKTTVADPVAFRP